MSYPVSEDGATPESSGFPFAIVIGAVLAVIGLGLVVFSVGMRDDSPLFVLGAVVFGVGVVRLTPALAKEARLRRAYLANPDDPRWHGGAGIRQLAGRSCVECGRKIVVGTDAVPCTRCEEAVHVDCRARHRATTHEGQKVAMRR